MNVAIIEYQNDVEEALNYFRPQDCLFLSVSAEASYCLSKMNIKFLTDEEILTPAEFKAIGNGNFGLVENWIQQLEQALQAKVPLFKERQFFPFKWHFYRLKILLDAVRIKKILIEKLMEKEKPSLIGAPIGTVPEEIHNHELFFHKYDSLYGLLVQKIAAAKGIEIKNWRKVNSTAERSFSIDRTKSFLMRLKKGLGVALESSRVFNQRQIKGNILLGSLDYDIAPMRQELSNKFGFYFYENSLCIRSLSSLLKLKPKTLSYEFPEINIKDIFKGINATGEPIVDEILSARVKNYAQRFIPLLWKGLNYLESIDCQKKFKAYIHYAGASTSFYGLPVFYFKRENKPIVIVQHGAYGFGLNRLTEYCEFAHDGWFFAWGEGVKEMYEERKKASCKIIPTGSHLIEEIKKKSKPRKTISKVCYIPGIYRGYTAYYPNGQPCLDSKMFIMETNFLLALKPFTERYNITYKVAPEAVKESAIFGKSPMLVWLREHLPMIRIESRPLSSVIHKFDLFIIDFPTTTLVQTLASGAEVLVYTGNHYYTLTEDALEMLQKRAVVGFDEDDFKDKIKSVLDKGVVISNVADTSFLKKYGVYLNDGKSLKRTVDWLTALCRN